MMRPSRSSPTGSSPARLRFSALLAALLVGSTLAAHAGAQSLKLHGLRLPPQELVGTWVSYHGRAQSRGSAIREFDQRLAVVERQDLGNGRWGLWVELKTTDARGSDRIERGFFGSPSLRGQDLLPGGDGSQIGGGSPGTAETPEPDPAPAGAGPDSAAFVLLRYQVLTPGGKLYEYPVGTTRYARAAGDVASFELFEYDPNATPIRETVGPDTLLLGRRLVPATVERTIRHGADRWPMGDDPNVEYHLVLTQTAWTNPAIPVTGYARSVFQADVKPFDVPPSAGGDSTAAAPDSTRAEAPAEAGVAVADSAAVPAPADSASAPESPAVAASADAAPPKSETSARAEEDRARGVLAWTEMTLVDLGADARPEVDQEPELAPDFDEPDVDPSGFIR